MSAIASHLISTYVLYFHLHSVDVSGVFHTWESNTRQMVSATKAGMTFPSSLVNPEKSLSASLQGNAADWPILFNLILFKGLEMEEIFAL